MCYLFVSTLKMASKSGLMLHQATLVVETYLPKLEYLSLILEVSFQAH